MIFHPNLVLALLAIGAVIGACLMLLYLSWPVPQKRAWQVDLRCGRLSLRSTEPYALIGRYAPAKWAPVSGARRWGSHG